MRLIRGLRSSGSDLPAAVTIGNFDGVHLGHQTILKGLCQRAAELSVVPTVVSFDPLPEEVFLGDKAPARLSRFREKWTLLNAFGVGQLCQLRFSAALAAMSPQEFVDQVLVRHLRTRYLIVGDDFRFGHQRAGNFDFLVAAGARAGFGVTATSTIREAGVRVSSTLVREALLHHRLGVARALLGRDYSFLGRVVYGDQRGRKMGFPTANLSVGRRRLAVRGVFAVIGQQCETGREFVGVANIGYRPTLEGQQARIEAHWFDFDGDLYGSHFDIRLVYHVRDERRFESLEMLAAQIGQDCQSARDFFAGADRI